MNNVQRLVGIYRINYLIIIALLNYIIKLILFDNLMYLYFIIYKNHEYNITF